jgi:hypothetical protein
VKFNAVVCHTCLFMQSVPVRFALVSNQHALYLNGLPLNSRFSVRVGQ